MLITKTVRFPVSYIQEMQKGEKTLTFQEFQREAWDCQKEMRAALNAMSSKYKISVEREVDFFNQNGRWPKKEDTIGWYVTKEGKSVSLQTLLYHVASERTSSSEAMRFMQPVIKSWENGKRIRNLIFPVRRHILLLRVTSQ